MKTVLITWLMSLSLAAFGQNVVSVEYFFDVDAGFGKNTVHTLQTPSADGPFSFTIDVSAASAGYHILYMRTRDSNGQWSHTTMRNVEVIKSQAVGNVASVEYFFDTDPGVGKAASTTLVTRADGSFAFVVPRDKTTPGAHTLYVRAKNNPDRNWSLTQWKAITIVNCTPPDQPAVVANQTICAGGTATFAVPSVALATGYRWAVPAGWAITGGQGTGTVTVRAPMVTTATNFTTLTVAAYNSCDTSQIRTFSTTVNPVPARPAITGSDTLLTSSIASGNQWFRNGTVVSGATAQTYRPSAAGQYTVQITQNGCTGPLSDAYNLIITATTEPDPLDAEVQIFPNPVVDNITILNRGSQPVGIRLYSMTGQLLTIAAGITGTYRVNAEALAPGCYMLLITRQDRRLTRLLVK